MNNIYAKVVSGVVVEAYNYPVGADVPTGFMSVFRRGRE